MPESVNNFFLKKGFCLLNPNCDGNVRRCASADACWAWPRGQIFSMCIYESMYHGKSDSHLNVCGREKWGEEDGRYFIQRHFENDLQTQGRTRTSAYAHNTQNHGSSAFPVM